jgi:hypothetical protein
MKEIIGKHISISQISTFFMCEMQYFFSYIQGVKIPPNAALTVGSATHKGVQKLYSDIKKSDKYYLPYALDAARDYIVKDTEGTVWDGITPMMVNQNKGTAIDRATAMVNAYSRSGYVDEIHQDNIEGVEGEDGEKIIADMTLKSDKCNTPPRIIGYVDLLLTDRVIDFKTSSRQQKTPDGKNCLQNGFYARAFGKTQSEIHHMSCNDVGKNANANEYSVPLIAENVLYGIIQTFWNTIEKKETSGDWLPTGMTHQWACSFCGYGDKGMCPFKLKLEG